VSSNIYLFMGSCEIKYPTYIVGWRLKARGQLLQSGRFIAEATSLVRSENKEQKPTTPAHSEQ
jgi:hypothetical protein